MDKGLTESKASDKSFAKNKKSKTVRDLWTEVEAEGPKRDVDLSIKASEATVKLAIKIFKRLYPNSKNNEFLDDLFERLVTFIALELKIVLEEGTSHKEESFRKYVDPVAEYSAVTNHSDSLIFDEDLQVMKTSNDFALT